MATTEPTAPIQRGSVDGRLSARIRPVTTAERSPSVPFLFITFLEIYSASTAEPTVVAERASALRPKYTTDMTRAGTSEMMTSSMMPVVVSLERTCGEGLTVSFFAIILHSPL